MQRPRAVILCNVYSLDTPAYDKMGAKDGRLRRHTEAIRARVGVTTNERDVWLSVVVSGCQYSVIDVCL